MFLLNTDRATLLPVSVETNVCCSLLAGDETELKKGKKRQLSLFFFPILKKQMKQNDASHDFFSPLLLFFFRAVGASVVHEQMANDNITGS